MRTLAGVCRLHGRRGALALAVVALGLAALAVACDGDGSSGTPDTPSAGASPTVGITPATGPLACAADSTERFTNVATEVAYTVYCPRTLPEGYSVSALDKLFTPGVLGPDDPNRTFVRTVFRHSNGDQITVLQGILGTDFVPSILQLYAGQEPATIFYGERQAEFYAGHGQGTDIPISGTVLLRDLSEVMYFISGDVDDETLRVIAAGMRAIEL